MKNSLNVKENLTFKENLYLNLFWLGFILYTISTTYTSTLNANFKIAQGAQILGLILIIPSIAKLIQFKFDSLYLGFIFCFYYLWIGFLILTNYDVLMNYEYLKQFLFIPHEGIQLLTPLILLFPKKKQYYIKLFDVIFIIGFVFLIFSILFLKDLISSDRGSLDSQGIVESFSNLSIPCGFILLTFIFQTKKKQVIALICILLGLAFVIIRARRGLILTYGTIIFFSYIIYFYGTQKKIQNIFFVTVIALFGALILGNMFKAKDSMFLGFILERGDENTRSDVEIYFYDDMRQKDWIFGRGLNGQYFCPDIEPDQETNYRNVIETGYLQIILKGGIIQLILFLLISIPAIFLGLFKTKNLLSKVAAIWLLIHLITLYLTINSFNLQYLLVWISIGIAFSKPIRNCSNNEIKMYFRTQII